MNKLSLLRVVFHVALARCRDPHRRGDAVRSPRAPCCPFPPGLHHTRSMLPLLSPMPRALPRVLSTIRHRTPRPDKPPGRPRLFSPYPPYRRALGGSTPSGGAGAEVFPAVSRLAASAPLCHPPCPASQQSNTQPCSPTRTSVIAPQRVVVVLPLRPLVRPNGSLVILVLVGSHSFLALFSKRF